MPALQTQSRNIPPKYVLFALMMDYYSILSNVTELINSIVKLASLPGESVFRTKNFSRSSPFILYI